MVQGVKLQQSVLALFDASAREARAESLDDAADPAVHGELVVVIVREPSKEFIFAEA